MPLPKEEFKVFISHATAEDGELANWIADALDRFHARAYIYERYKIDGQNRFETIKDMISICPYFLVILTADSIASQWVNQEIGYAVAAGKKLIPIIEVNDSTDSLLNSQGFVELHDPIPYYRNNKIWLIAEILYTVKNLLSLDNKWHDAVFLSCECGYDFDKQLQFNLIWNIFLNDPLRKPFLINWRCDKCGRTVSISFPDCLLSTS